MILQRIIQYGYDRIKAEKSLPAHVRRAAERICVCRTAALGGHLQTCPEGHVERQWYNSCKHRSCPVCAYTSVERWLDKQKARLVDCDYYHVIFTLPHDLHQLWLANVRAMTDLLFHATRDTLFELLEDPKYLGAEPGVIMALHTWGQTTGLHPHAHCLVTGGGLAPDGAWRAVKNGYLLPGRVARDLFRGKFLDAVRRAVEQDKLVVPPGERRQQVLNMLNKLGRAKWNVRIQERYAHGVGVVTYLGRYMRGGAISNRRIVAWDGGKVRIRYKDYRATDEAGRTKQRQMELSIEEFMQRLLLHVPEPGHKVVRSYGLFAGSRRADLDRCRQLVGQSPVEEPPVRSWQECVAPFGAANPGICPVCGARLIKREVFRPRRDGTEMPLKEAA